MDHLRQLHPWANDFSNNFDSKRGGLPLSFYKNNTELLGSRAGRFVHIKPRKNNTYPPRARTIPPAVPSLAKLIPKPKERTPERSSRARVLVVMGKGTDKPPLTQTIPPPNWRLLHRNNVELLGSQAGRNISIKPRKNNNPPPSRKNNTPPINSQPNEA